MPHSTMASLIHWARPWASGNAFVPSFLVYNTESTMIATSDSLYYMKDIHKEIKALFGNKIITLNTVRHYYSNKGFLLKYSY